MFAILYNSNIKLKATVRKAVFASGQSPTVACVEVGKGSLSWEAVFYHILGGVLLSKRQVYIPHMKSPTFNTALQQSWMNS